MLILIEREDSDYDETRAMIIRVEERGFKKACEAARKIASQNTSREKSGPDTWLNPEKAVCSKIKSNGEPGIILTDFLAA